MRVLVSTFVNIRPFTILDVLLPSASAGPSGSSAGAMDDDIPQDVLDQIAAAEAEEAARTGGRSSSGAGTSGAGGIRICPHCTFENVHGGTDCEVCGLPL